jgi:hypothetical protein
MPSEKPSRRLPLRQLLTLSEKSCRDLIEHVHATLLPRIADFRELTRPVRRRSHYPTLVAMQNALKKLRQATTEAQNVAEHLYEQLEDIHERAKREKISRFS